MAEKRGSILLKCPTPLALDSLHLQAMDYRLQVTLETGGYGSGGAQPGLCRQTAM